MQSVQKLIDYFLVVGLNDKVTQCNYGFNDEGKSSIFSFSLTFFVRKTYNEP